MGADKNVDFPFTRLFQNLCLLFSGTKTRQHFDTHRPVSKTVAEVVEVLLGQQRRWHEYRNLFVVFHREECGTHRNFGFTKADVATHQAIHGQWLAHVA
ncbi:hypothetical protein D3C75_828840 [compost metagenome]